MDTGRLSTEALRRCARPLDSWDSVLTPLADAEVVLIGESTHGTHDFYALRSELTKLLISERGFHAIALEADWADALRAGRRASPGPRLEDHEVVGHFQRFPSWMWRNRETAEFLAWLARFNGALQRNAPRVGLFGLDLHDPSVFRGPPQTASASAAIAGTSTDEELFFREQEARISRNAARYLNAVRKSYSMSWNLRDRHMAETLFALRQHLERTLNEPARIVVWAHNSHVGDARATEMGAAGELTLGQLARERWGRSVFSIGLLTHRGSVVAAGTWGGPGEVKAVGPALAESWEHFLHEGELAQFFLDLRPFRASTPTKRLERAIGAVYIPQTERESHYFEAALADQFDAILFVDETRALDALEAKPNRVAC